jgi:hypothetical protein
MALQPVGRVIVFTTKYGPVIFRADSEQERNLAALAQLRFLLTTGWYEGMNDKAEIRSIVQMRDAMAAWRMVRKRREQQYEGFSEEPVYLGTLADGVH